ncbi:tRNA (adenosine(37)-N6)-threonylcarbamoyltransferase complex ATPase subunit type 1 TsaE [Maribacter antarcticus]|uniref:tRNA (adenosine(37)-N6)-threonylcarbamoyltransferase complex ATPase subunit type 1 TsaE n=1 Tax=Maribacter antarcticus TaxID=505250 RepID=UPI000478757C|nr:tRNA (adenosine(37)-N6)-threonylcarbamoyltransferase complex ATPase subunit type 1 TsaE [Maribacter antarcticus]
MKNIAYSEEDINQIAKQIIATVASKCLAFYAPMGAGKTTLTKALVAELGGVDMVSSPTFGIVNEYHDTNGALLAYHFDFYRLKDEMEAMDMGLEVYLDSKAWIFMEWPEKIPNLIPTEAVIIRIEILNPTERRIMF